jgi:hypothetical protein
MDSLITRLEDTGRWKAALAPTGDETHHLVALYMRAIYSPHAPSSADMDEAQEIWRKLRWRLWFQMIVPRSSDFSRLNPND